MASNDPDQDMAASPISATITDVGGFRTTGPDVVNAVKGLGEVASQYDAFLIGALLERVLFFALPFPS